MANSAAPVVALELVNKAAVVPNNAERERVVDDIVRSSGFRVVSFLNANAVVLATRDVDFYQALRHSDYLFRDGVGCEVLMWAAGKNPGVNCNGTDLIAEIVKALRERRVSFYGTREPFLTKAVATATRMGVKVVDRCDGFHTFGTYATRIKQSCPEFVVLGMGMPKQELLSLHLRDNQSEYSTVIINGGAFVDFLANRVSRAPKCIRRARLEWFYRFLKEPRRLFRRYLIDGPAFLLIVLRVLILRYSGRMA